MPARPASAHLRAFVATARRAVLATVDDDGMPRLVPLSYVLAPEPARDAAAGAVGEPEEAGGSLDRPLVLYSAIDEKPKRAEDPLALARVRDLLARPFAAVLVDRWSEDWRHLGWVRLACRGEIVPPAEADLPPGEHERAVAALRAKYPQYRVQRLEGRPLIRLTCSVAASWGAIEERS